MKNEISIVMPAYNAEKFIVETLKKLELQTYKNFKVILINDGSTDNTLLKINNYKKYTKLNLEIINQNNLGEGEARNTGLKFLSTKYVLFLDCDDYLEKNALEKFIKEIEETESDLVCSSYSKVDLNGKEIKEILYKTEVINDEEILKQFLLRNINPGIGNSLIKTEIVKKNKLKFGKYSYGADTLFFRYLVLNCKKMKVINEKLFFYVNNPSSVMNTNFTHKRLEVLESIEEFRKRYNGKLEKYIDISYNIELMGIFLVAPFKIYELKIPKINLRLICEHKTYKKIMLILMALFSKKILYKIFNFIKKRRKN